MLTADLEIFMYETSFDEVLGNFIENEMSSLGVCDEQIDDFLGELAEQLNLNLYPNNDYEDDLARAYFDLLFYSTSIEQYVEYIRGIHINDTYRTPYLRIKIAEHDLIEILQELLSNSNIKDFEYALNNWDFDSSLLLDTIKERNFGGYVHADGEEVEDELEADRVYPIDIDDFSNEDFGKIIYCYLALKSDSLYNIDSYIDGIKERSYDAFPDYEIIGHYDDNSFEEVLDWANENYTFKPKLSSKDFTATNIIYDLSNEAPYQWNEEQEAFVWDVNKTNGQLQFESLKEQLMRVTGE